MVSSGTVGAGLIAPPTVSSHDPLENLLQAWSSIDEKQLNSKSLHLKACQQVM